MAKAGYIVQLKDKRKGYTYPIDGLYAGKAEVYICDAKTLKKTGEKVLCNPDDLLIIGFTD